MERASHTLDLYTWIILWHARSPPVQNEVDNSPNHFVGDATADLVVIRSSPKLNGSSVIQYGELTELVIPFQIREIVV